MGSGMKLTRRRFLGAMGATLVGGATYSFGVEPVWLQTQHHAALLPHLPAAFRGYTIAQLSDLHVGAGVPSDFLRRAVTEANAHAPDLIVVTGDLVDTAGDRMAVREMAGILKEASAPDGVLACLGNHDTGVYAPRQRADAGVVPVLGEALDRAGVELLHNACRRIARGGEALRLAGLGDLWSRQFDAAPVARPEPGACTVVLTHNPDAAPLLADLGVDLVLCGHTHGGQIDLPLVGPPYIPLRHKQFLEGPFRLDGTRLYVNRGLGWTHRVRFGARPEVTIHRLEAAGGDQISLASRPSR